MLGWLKEIAPWIPIILMIRHPLQVISSWVKLGWGKEAKGERMDYDIVTSQNDLLNDFSIIKKAIYEVNPQNHFERLIFLWCIYHYVPFNQLKSGEAYILFYENLIIQPENEIQKLFKFLNKLKIPMDITAAGIDAETVMPANSPRYALAPARTIDRIIPSIMALIVISGC